MGDREGVGTKATLCCKKWWQDADFFVNVPSTCNIVIFLHVQS